jgi:hypothetical protein
MASLSSLLKDIADAIRSKKGSTSHINPQDFAMEIASIEGGGGYTANDIASGLVSGDLYFSTDVIAAYSFYNDTGITSVDAPNVTTIGTYAFYNIANITSINAPNVTTIGNYAFTAPKVTKLDFPLLTSIGTNCFTNCPTIKNVKLPELGAVGASCFGYIGVSRLVLPKATSVGNSALTNSKSLKYVDLPKCTAIDKYGLRNNSLLETLILRSETMCTLSNYALNSTKIKNKTGYVYVPSALIESYKVATNWSTIFTQFRALEDYTIDGTINGELDESKI